MATHRAADGDSPSLVIVDGQGSWALKAVDRHSLSSRAWQLLPDDPTIFQWDLLAPGREVPLPACFAGFTALFGPTSRSYDDWKGSFRWLLGCWPGECSGMVSDVAAIIEFRDWKGCLELHRWFPEPQDAVIRRTARVAVAVRDHAGRVAHELLPQLDFVNHVPAVNLRYGASRGCWFEERSTQDLREQPAAILEWVGAGAWPTRLDLSSLLPDPLGSPWCDAFSAIIIQRAIRSLADEQRAGNETAIATAMQRFTAAGMPQSWVEVVQQHVGGAVRGAGPHAVDQGKQQNT